MSVNINASIFGQKRMLIIHGDDLGMSHSINEANFRALEEGAISSASVMPCCTWLPQVSEYLAKSPKTDIGLHLVLTSEFTQSRWRPLSSTAKQNRLMDDSGYFYQTREALFSKAISIRGEIASQLAALRSIGMTPSHIDSHMMAALHPKFLNEYVNAALEEGLLPLLPQGVDLRPLCNDSNQLRRLPGANVIEVSRTVPAGEWMAFYVKEIAKLPLGLNVLLVHLGYDTEELRAVCGSVPGWDAAWRQRDFDVITSESFRYAIESEGISVVNWRDVQNYYSE